MYLVNNSHCIYYSYNYSRLIHTAYKVHCFRLGLCEDDGCACVAVPAPGVWACVVHALKDMETGQVHR